MNAPTTTRRRFVAIAAVAGSLAGSLPARAAAVEPTVWRGRALGAAASITLVDADRARARSQIDACVEEIERLEAVFSLYRADSALVRLNRDGELRAPPHDLVELLALALDLARRSGGAFDPTVQPLYRLHADHFARAGAAPAGPSAAAIARVLRRVDHRAVDVRPDRITLRPGMAITLNGIAQGYVTDAVADRLRAAGFADVLIDLGEARVLGQRPGGGAWRAAVADPRDAERRLFELRLGERDGLLPALATSAGLGSPFGPDPRLHHLLDPRSGRSANHHLAVTVEARRATLADGLSTALSIVPPDRFAPLLQGLRDVRVHRVDATGRVDVATAPGATAASAVDRASGPRPTR